MKTDRGKWSSVWTLDTFVIIFCIFISLAAAKANPRIYYGKIAENAPAGSVVRGILVPFGEKCHESNWTDHPATVLRGTDVSDFHLVSYHGKGFALLTTKTLDREVKPMYIFSAVAPSCFDSPVEIEVEVIAANHNNKLYFRSDSERIEVNNLKPLGSELTRIRALIDSDADRNADVRYYVFPPNKYIHVIPKTGQVMLVHSLETVNNTTALVYARDQRDDSAESEPLALHIDVQRTVPKVRKPRAVSEDLFYTVTVSEDVKIGDMVFTVPDQKFDKKWFEVISEADAPVQIERDSGRLYLAQRLKSTTEVVVKIQNMRGKKPSTTNSPNHPQRCTHLFMFVLHKQPCRRAM